ncbi:patatin-like phospholipase family protein [Legionella maceachernii]|uniref:Esterase of the alpha-beta hydrolase superfamily protein n=1 Tax=Legionella maceachernii TaxID=466 RepID=A0A0W0W1I0_9GAMM|nr:patatin-like phospholipase family protein [Legionella maceachernii]KTD26030.1 esterase of the alpha-beta hydrolase superfamily protein [Legionella maceachernii]SJZ51094.1 Patatin-like phospholipase [Legionella maceachernii]SUP03706.1 Uncharacterised protein [Legionella maceachernii]
MPTKRSITNLTFQGGSVKGPGHIGGLESLSKKIDMKKVRRVAGTSAGSITASPSRLRWLYSHQKYEVLLFRME